MFRVSCFGIRDSGFGFRVSGFRFRVSGFGFWGSGVGSLDLVQVRVAPPAGSSVRRGVAILAQCSAETPTAAPTLPNPSRSSPNSRERTDNFWLLRQGIRWVSGPCRGTCRCAASPSPPAGANTISLTNQGVCQHLPCPPISLTARRGFDFANTSEAPHDLPHLRIYDYGFRLFFFFTHLANKKTPSHRTLQ